MISTVNVPYQRAPLIRPAWLPPMGRALMHRNFRLFMFGQGISVIGSWMQNLATGWLLYRLSNSSMLLGLSDFVSAMPAVVFLLFVGVLTDRWNRRQTVIVMQSLAMLQAFALTALTYFGVINVWQIFALGIFLGLVNSFDSTARQALMVEMVDRPEDLANAIAINASVFNGARLVGPAIAGMVICFCGNGEWPCFLLNALSYIPVIASLVMMRIPRCEVAHQRQGIIEGFSEGIGYVAGSLPIRSLLILVALVGAMAAPLSVLMPVMAKEVLHGGAETLGFLTASLGVGALAASLFLASRKNVLGLCTLIAIATGGFGICLDALACSHTLWLSSAVLCATGFAMIAQFAAVNMVLQTIVDEGKRGRVMSFYTMAFIGVAPIGSLFSGYMASHVGVAATLVMCGAVCIVGSLVFAAILPSIRHAMRTIYVRVGVLAEPEPAFAPGALGILEDDAFETSLPAVGEAA